MTIRTVRTVCLFTMLAASSGFSDEAVTVDNFVRAESDRYFQSYVDKGGFGKLIHRRNLAPIDDQSVIRMNRDTLYSVGVFDLSNPVVIQKPEIGSRYQSMQIISQDHHTKLIVYEPGKYTITQEMVGTRYATVLFRTLVDTTLPNDISDVNDIQDRISISQSSIGNFEIPVWDGDSLNRLRDALNVLGVTVPVSDGMFGDIDTVNPIHHMIGAAYGWGGIPAKDAIYVNVTPEYNDGETAYTLVVDDVPVDGFWSISLYDETGYFQKNEANAYSVNNLQAVGVEDGRITVHFGGDPDQPNYLHIMNGWNYVIRLYRPRSEIFDGSWDFPEAQPVE